MGTRVERRWTPLLVVAAVLAIAFVAIARLPESYVAQLARSRPLSRDEADWAYRLLAFAAIAQALYGGFSLLHTDRIYKLRTADPAVAGMPRDRIMVSVMRTAATLVFLTFVYGFAAFVITGQRGGFWLFAVVALLQGAWYVRQVNAIARYLDFQTDPEPSAPGAEWKQPPSDYAPPIARGLEAQNPREPVA